MAESRLADTDGRIASRDSNIELLRIVCMAMIVAHHLVLHGGIFEHAGGNTADLLCGGVLLPGGKIGYDCFIIITAWFCAGKEFKGSRIVKTALEVIFYNFAGMALAAVLNAGSIEPITVRNWFGCFFPLFGISHGFAVYYMIFLMILPLLNAASERMGRRNILSVIMLAFLMQIWAKIFSFAIDFSPFVDLSNGLFTFIILYFAVVYIKRYPLNICSRKNILALVLAFIWFANALVNILAVKYPEARLFSLATVVLNGDISPLNMAAGFCLFFIFKKMGIKHSRIINFTAGRTFGILLLHDHNYFRYVIWKRVFFVENFYDAGLPVLIAYVVIVVSAVFAAGMIADTIREYIFEKPMQKTGIYSKASGFLESCFKIPPFKGDV